MIMLWLHLIAIMAGPRVRLFPFPIQLWVEMESALEVRMEIRGPPRWRDRDGGMDVTVCRLL